MAGARCFRVGWANPGRCAKSRGSDHRESSANGCGSVLNPILLVFVYSPADVKCLKCAGRLSHASRMPTVEKTDSSRVSVWLLLGPLSLLATEAHTLF